MRKTALTILGAACVAALLLVIAAAKSRGYDQPHPYTAAAWLSAILAFGVCAVMLVEYYIHRREMHLYLGAAFFALGIMGVWDALALHSAISGSAVTVKYQALWKAQWITLSLAVVTGFAMHCRARANRGLGYAGPVMVGGILWAALVIFLTQVVPAISTALAGNAGAVISALCAVVFLAGYLVYSRTAVNRNNAILGWMAYGLVFGAFAQVAEIPVANSTYKILFGFASLMKVLVYASPLAGMLAEHTRMQVRMHNQASELSNLVQLQQAMATLTSPREIFERLVNLTSNSFAGSPVCLLAYDRERGLLEPAAGVGFDEDALRQLTFRPSEGPPGEVFSRREAAFIKDISKDATLSRKFEGTGISGKGAVILTPLVVGTDCLGVLGLFFTGSPLQGKKLSKDQQRLVDAFTNQAALALENARAHDRMLDTAKTSDDNLREMGILWEIGWAVAAKIDLQDLIDTLAEQLRTVVGAKTCSVLLFDPNDIGLKIMGRRKLARYQSVEEHIDQCDKIAAAVARHGAPLVANNVSNSCHCKYTEMATDDGGSHHLLSVPMSLPGFVGAISVFRQNAEPFGEREKRLLTRLAPVVASAIRNAELYGRERHIAKSLQEVFLPELPSEFPGVQILQRYQPAFYEARVGGDFFDVMELCEGKYGFVIGDVSGKGLDAAIYTAMSRYTIQAYCAQEDNPATVVSKLNASLYRFTPDTKFVTLVYGIVDVKANKLTYVNAGHEYPFLFKASEGRSFALPTTGPAAGAIAEAAYESQEVAFEPGDVLFLYTDGASEARNDGNFLGTEGLKDIVDAEIQKGTDDLPNAVLNYVLAYSDSRLRDDVALLSIKYRKPGSLF